MTRRPTRQEKGVQGERIVGLILELRGYEVLHYRFRRATGEIDIIAVNPHRVLFVEVKTRNHKASIDPFTSLTKARRKRMFDTARLFLQENPQLQGRNGRFDLVALYLDEWDRPQLMRWFKNQLTEVFVGGDYIHG